MALIHSNVLSSGNVGAIHVEASMGRGSLSQVSFCCASNQKTNLVAAENSFFFFNIQVSLSHHQVSNTQLAGFLKVQRPNEPGNTSIKS